jgi:protein-tyrosine-phosphatase
MNEFPDLKLDTKALVGRPRNPLEGHIEQRDMIIAMLRKTLRTVRQCIRHSDTQNMVVDMSRPNQTLAQYIDRALKDSR